MSEKWDRQLSEKWEMLNLGTHPLGVSEKWDTFFGRTPTPIAHVRKMGYRFLAYTHPIITCQKNGIPFFCVHPPQNHMSEKWDTFF